MWVGVLVSACSGPIGTGDGIVEQSEVPVAGWTGTWEGFAHDVAGEATLLDGGVLELTDFTYDGGGVDARLFLVADGAAFDDSLQLTDSLVGMPFESETFRVDLPEEAMDGSWDTVVLWCVPFAAEFGHAVLRPPPG